MSILENIPEVPVQKEGVDKDFLNVVKFPDLNAARAAYDIARARLLSVNAWKQFCEGGADFKVFSANEELKDDTPAVGDFIRIDIPGPGTLAGRGFDWVQIEELTEQVSDVEDYMYCTIRVRPAHPPGTASDRTAHFFAETSTSNFIVLRESVNVYAAVFGRNETINSVTDLSILDKIRNFIVGTGAKAGMSDKQWKSLIEGFLKKEEEMPRKI